MTRTSPYRRYVAWTLYFCVLFNVFVCGLGHGQVAGLELNGVGGQFCSALGNQGLAVDTDFSDQAGAGWLNTLVCPLCSAVTLGLGLLFCLAWLLRRQCLQRPKVAQHDKAPPRYGWPPLNPRAPPLS
ncbi:DUF2946 domain-containing protein [Pseudomonas sp. CMR5c]|uniref:DUF2946 domain-containing protein n=1 Tax=Pseudomonas sp. CMR5c TaxID=658630 RepID=UPI00069EDF57|nr:DUF2946 domain-containing protein [Pseudomonas sp. CMR5c]AZC19663.1 hypothetical protein C4K40_4282 [Pseudomonas sp. CMR5c]